MLKHKPGNSNEASALQERTGVALVHKQNENHPCEAAAKQLIVSNIVLQESSLPGMWGNYYKPLGAGRASAKCECPTDVELCLHLLRNLERVLRVKKKTQKTKKPNNRTNEW